LLQDLRAELPKYSTTSRLQVVVRLTLVDVLVQGLEQGGVSPAHTVREAAPRAHERAQLDLRVLPAGGDRALDAEDDRKRLPAASAAGRPRRDGSSHVEAGTHGADGFRHARALDRSNLLLAQRSSVCTRACGRRVIHHVPAREHLGRERDLLEAGIRHREAAGDEVAAALEEGGHEVVPTLDRHHRELDAMQAGEAVEHSRSNPGRAPAGTGRTRRRR